MTGPTDEQPTLDASGRGVTYNFEYSRKVKACFIGAGGHSFRNIYPAFQYAPIELVAICDVDEPRAIAYARQFGALRHYTDHRVMLDRERPEAVFIVTSVNSDGSVQATKLALDVLAAGAHVWMEKPTAATSEEVDALIAASARHGRWVMTGLKKVFFPSIERTKEIITQAEFGRPASMYIRYPQAMPAFSQRGSLPAMGSFLDHIFHPFAIIHYLMGRIERLVYEWEPTNGGSVTTMRFQSGAIGTLHLAAGQSNSSPFERLEVVGEHANVVLENAVKLTYYRPVRSTLPAYGRNPNYLVATDDAPLHWEPEFSLGELANKNLFYLGYVQEVLHFCESVIEGRAPTKGTLQDAAEIVRIFEAYQTTPPGVPVIINAAVTELPLDDGPM